VFVTADTDLFPTVQLLFCTEKVNLFLTQVFKTLQLLVFCCGVRLRSAPEDGNCKVHRNIQTASMYEATEYM
jgi:hypothetical protein